MKSSKHEPSRNPQPQENQGCRPRRQRGYQQSYFREWPKPGAKTAHAAASHASQLNQLSKNAINVLRHMREGRLIPVFGLDMGIKVKAHFAVYPPTSRQTPAGGSLSGLAAWGSGQMHGVSSPRPTGLLESRIAPQGNPGSGGLGTRRRSVPWTTGMRAVQGDQAPRRRIGRKHSAQERRQGQLGLVVARQHQVQAHRRQIERGEIGGHPRVPQQPTHLQVFRPGAFDVADTTYPRSRQISLHKRAIGRPSIYELTRS